MDERNYVLCKIFHDLFSPVPHQTKSLLCKLYLIAFTNWLHMEAFPEAVWPKNQVGSA